MNNKFKCRKCNKTYPVDELKYKCDCEGLFNIEINNEDLWDTNLTLGEGNTPIIRKELGGNEVFLKLDYMMPTGSFKDRGAVVLIDQLRNHGIKEIVEDSSGNAGASIAAYAAAAGIKCSIYLPEKTSEKKVKQIKAYGADIVKISGNRQATSEAVLEAAENAYYASHVYNPLFFTGTSSLAYELMDNPGKPDLIFVPVGNGTMLLGLYYGFKKIGYLPRLMAVQSRDCSPIFSEIYEENFSVNATLAEGIAVEDPPRKEEIIRAIKDSKGDIIKVSDFQIKKAYHQLAEKGLYIEPTAAAAPAGFIKYSKERKIMEDRVVIPLTGTGLKK